MGMWCKSLGVHQFSHVTQNSKIMNGDQWATIALKKLSDMHFHHHDLYDGKTNKD
jgi:2-hydroxy-3-keto-5-methylthiopentenyl-1-phosphate phosphatase